MVRFTPWVFAGAAVACAVVGCAHFVEMQAIDHFTTALQTDDLNKLKASASSSFDEKALRRDKDSLEALKNLPLHPDEKVTIVKVEDVANDKKKVVVTTDKSHKKMQYNLVRDEKSSKWIVDDIVLKQTTKDVTANKTVTEQIETHTLSVLVDNEPGVLARVIGLFSGRGYNIDSLTVSETEHEKHLSRITIVTRGTPMVIEQIKNQLDRLVPVHRVVDMTVAGPHIERELAMVKVRGKGDQRMEALRLADAFRARVIDASTESFVFEITGASDKIESFVALMIPLGLVEVSRTGIVAIGRGPEGM